MKKGIEFDVSSEEVPLSLRLKSSVSALTIMIMSQRRKTQSKDEETAVVEPLVRPPEQGKKPSTTDNSGRARFFIMKARVVLTFMLLAMLLSSIFSQIWWTGGIAKIRNRNVHSVFSRCKETDGVVSPASGVPSDEARRYPCVYLRPSLYFFDPSYPGYQYKQLINDVASNIRLNMWGKQVSDLSPNAVGPSHLNSFLVQQGITSVSTVMIPKVASRTIDSLFLERLSVQQKTTTASTTTTVTTRAKKGPKVGIATPAFWKEVARRQSVTRQRQQRSSDIVFALLRDPVARFLSSLAQTISAPMLKKWENNLKIKNKPLRFQVWQPCLNSTSSTSYSMLVRCVIDSMKEKEVGYFDVHVAPQAVFLGGALNGNNVKVAIFSMDHLDAVLDAFGATTRQKNKRESKVYPPDVLNRFGTELLDPAKARESLSDDMVRDICDLYAVDVDLMRYLGFAVKDCIE
jgi:hypothetical protein